MLTLGMSQLIVHINIHLSSLIKKLVNDLFNTMLFLAQGRSHFIRIKTSLIKAFNPPRPAAINHGVDDTIPSSTGQLVQPSSSPSPPAPNDALDCLEASTTPNHMIPL
jgi:hypothetical protein